MQTRLQRPDDTVDLLYIAARMRGTVANFLFGHLTLVIVIFAYLACQIESCG
jgi:hypothetical protein